MHKSELLGTLAAVESYAVASKLSRFFKKPFRYTTGLTYRELVYKIFQKGLQVNTRTFWGGAITLVLPADMDIYLSGGKTHSSEIRLTRFLIHHLRVGDQVLDVGAHIGFYSLLAVHLVGENGKILAVEAAPNTFSLLQQNAGSYANINAINAALSNISGNLEFLQLPVLYSEYNTLEKEQYQAESWFKKINTKVVEVPALTGSDLINNHDLQPQIIKIDVEGAEEKVVSGLIPFLENHDPTIIMEFAHPERGNKNHILAEAHLQRLGYKAFAINNNGELIPLTTDTSNYVVQVNLVSDNIVYRKK